MPYVLSEDQKLQWLLNELRSSRNLKLMQSDWTQLPDVPLTDAKKAEWAVYRQQLRDLPSTVTGLNSDRTISANYPVEPA